MSAPALELEAWADEHDQIPLAFLLHPDVTRGSQLAERTVRSMLEKKKLALDASVSCADFAKMAARVQRRDSIMMEVPAAGDISPEAYAEKVAIAAFNQLVSAPRWREDLQPTEFSDWLVCGSAEHAADIATLRKLRVRAVLNCAPSACRDEELESRYSAEGIVYGEVDAYDWEGYPLFELHLAAAKAFCDEHSPKAPVGFRDRVLLHCESGVEQSAALSLALLMVKQRQPLLAVVRAAWERRPYILATNASFREQLVRLALARGLLLEADDVAYQGNYPDSTPSEGAADEFVPKLERNPTWIKEMSGTI